MKLFARLSALAAAAALAVTPFASATHLPPADAHTQISILDTLGVATSASSFSVFGAGGQTIASSQLVGPAFELERRTVIARIGAFVNNCAMIVLGVPQCPHTKPFVVQIRPAVNGRPDPDHVLGSFVLSHDDDSLTYSFEFVRPNLSLGPGEYFALFAPQGTDAGALLGFASSPFNYLAGSTTLGFLDPATGTSFVSEQFAAVQVLGLPARH